MEFKVGTELKIFSHERKVDLNLFEQFGTEQLISQHNETDGHGVSISILLVTFGDTVDRLPRTFVPSCFEAALLFVFQLSFFVNSLAPKRERFRGQTRTHKSDEFIRAQTELMFDHVKCCAVFPSHSNKAILIVG
jgi:hypothetical protein